MSDTPSAPEPGPETPFEIGLVMAGAVSAGAYTAGVIDFLVEALDRWEEAKAFARAHPDDPKAKDCPTHSVKIKVMAGASAGGMSAAIAAGMLGMKFETVTRQPPPDRPANPVNNNLYQSWVNKVDIVPMLGLKDLDGRNPGPIQSVLDSSILLDIANAAFTYDRPNDRVSRPYVSDPLHVLITVTNLRGVPYAPEFANWPKTQQYEMMMHADNMHFILSKDQPKPEEGAFWLEPYEFGRKETWGVLQSTALATGAFPVGLAPRLLSRLASHYSFRQWAMPGPHEENGVHYCEYWQTVPPFWHSNGKAQGTGAGAGAGADFTYDFLCVDGGVMNNEPLDLARRILTGPGGISPSAGDRATRAVIMVLPFPNAATDETPYDGKTNLFQLLFTTFNSLISQARFKPGELAMANDPNVYSRFLIVPRRGYRPDGTLEPYTIACGSLGGFGGFLARKFREHDYQLGRRNCQWFLKQYFALPSDGPQRNALFDKWTPEARKAFKVVPSTLAQAKGPEGDGNGDDVPLLPIIPLMGDAAVYVDPPTWPNLTARELDALRPRIKERLNRVVKALVDQNIAGLFWGPLARGALKSAWWFQSGKAVDRVMEIIRDDLSKRGLMGR